MNRIITASMFLLLAGCSSNSHSRKLDGAYGSIAYKGNVSWRTDGANRIYSVKQLSLTLVSGQHLTNATQAISAPEMCFVTAVRPPKPGPWQKTFESCVPAHFRLSAKSPTAIVDVTKFVVPMKNVTSGDVAGFELIDRHDNLAWPIFEDFRNYRYRA